MMEKDIQVYEPEEIILSDQIVDQVLQRAERRMINLKRLKEYALSLTNEKDWFDMGGKPYLCGAGSEKVGRPFGVRIKFIPPNILGMPNPQKIKGTDALGEYYLWIYYGTASLGVDGADEIDVQGICSSRDKFFAITDGALKPISEVDEPNIMKKALNNLIMNGITRILGLRNLT
jgi:hypothetical protein